MAYFRQIRIFLNSGIEPLEKELFLENRCKYVEFAGKKWLQRKKFGNYLTGIRKMEKKPEKIRNRDKIGRKRNAMEQERGG